MAKKKESGKGQKSLQHGCKESNPFVAIPCKVGGIFLLIALVVVLFGADEWVLVPIAIAFMVLGFFALLYAYRAEYNKQMKR